MMYNRGMTGPLRILAMFAHPDDELSAGGTLAKYAHSGADITLVCATRGEAATIFCADCATRETLAEVRTGELVCCCHQLGIQHLEWLDWPDGGVTGVPEDQAVAQIVPIVRRVRPHVLFTHPQHGGYPHPDHIGIYQRVLAAWKAAADPGYLLAAGPAWATPKVYTRAIPEAAFDALPGFRDYRVHLNGQKLPFVSEPLENLHCVIDTADWVDTRAAGWACHVSQHNPNGMFSNLPVEAQRQVYSREHFRLVAHHLPAGLPPHDALEAGLEFSAPTENQAHEG